jgi:nucleoside-diphosphate-sugar epimerase
VLGGVGSAVVHLSTSRRGHDVIILDSTVMQDCVGLAANLSPPIASIEERGAECGGPHPGRT